MAHTWGRSKLRMKLHAKKPMMIGQLHDFRQLFIRCSGTDHQTGLLQAWNVNIIDLIAVSMSFVDGIPINLMGQSTRLDRAGLRPLAHGPPHIILMRALLYLALPVMPLGD